MSDFMSSNGDVRQAQQAAAYTDLNSLQKIKSEGNKDVALQKVAKQFESMFVSMLFKGMRQANAVFEKGNMGHSNAEKMYRDMHDQQLSLNISEGRGMGISDMVYRQLKGSTQRQSNVEEFKLDESHKLTGLSPYAKSEGRLEGTRVPQLNEDEAKVFGRASPEAKDVDTSQTRHDLFEAKTPLEFASKLLPIAKKVASAAGLDPLMMVAQAALETGWGQHMVKDALGQSSNNVFNIKADKRWAGDSVSTQTLEYRDGIAQKESARFRRYDSVEEGVRDFVNFIHNNPRYAKALDNKDNPESFIQELQQAGYATDPAYASKVKSVYLTIQQKLSVSESFKSEADRVN